MIINHPLLGPRDAQEFVYLGDAALIHRPDGMADRRRGRVSSTTPICATTRPGCTASFGITNRATAPGWSSPATPLTHEITAVELARDVARAEGRSK